MANGAQHLAGLAVLLTVTKAIAAMEGAGYIDAWKATQSGEGWTG